ncbi:Lrp/AsnC family transcriptional regulator [Streptomyces griseoviridis]|uniref:Lrp/AsnC family transcriptional regulator n=1 Tax=Streptomyces hintoniae TaxID=3075521 RepID=A0ABU2UW69_9ACTN|nr:MULTISPECIES: Lrp/AsnC family transcriptional regulator [unclassified Streptomyces]MDH6695860.1 Lrp/AsnC family transcriptional regulator for asnA, asnC and gidA [Streptomyces sp. MAA16]MDT0477532.1 Lrp/AsnC family transcriptional regulator [Streptomyces sp. DSM 41014]
MIDDLDRQIIDQLRVDGRKSFGEIGRSIGLSEASVRARFQRLKRRGAIQVVGMTDAVRLGEMEVHLAVRVHHIPVALVARELSRMPEIRYVASCVGPYDLILDVRCRDLGHLSELLTERVRRVNGVAHAEALTVLDVVKDSYLWAGFREVPADPGQRILPQ